MSDKLKGMPIEHALAAVQRDKFNVEAWDNIMTSIRRNNIPASEARPIYEDFLSFFPYSVSCISNPSFIVRVTTGRCISSTNLKKET